MRQNGKTAGIICECNPLHAGHVYLMEQARRAGAETVVCVMSGCFVQRGEAAIISPHARAEILIRAGADAVLELPFPFAASGAEFFGSAGVDILSRLGVDELWFGSECGDLDLLSRMANIADDPAFLARYSETAQGSGGTARAYFDCMRDFCGEEACSPNDILALSYLRAIRKSGSAMRPVTVRRQGSGYNETALEEQKFPSATALRLAWRKEGLDAIRPFLPIPCAQILEREAATGIAPATLQNAEAFVLGALRLSSREDLERIAGLGGGLAGRIGEAAMRASSVEELYALCATKKYTDARVRRGILFALLGVEEGTERQPAAYVRLLAANQSGCAFLGAVRKRARIPVVTRKTDLPHTEEAERQFAMETREKALYSLCFPQPRGVDFLLCRTPVILSDGKTEKIAKK